MSSFCHFEQVSTAAVTSATLYPARTGARLPRAALIAAVVVIAGSAAWLVNGQAKAPVTAPPAVPLAASIARQAQPVAAAPPGLVPSDVEGIILHGTLVTASMAAAIVSDGAAGQRRIVAGQDIRPGIRLAAVAADHIVAARGPARLQIPLARFGGTMTPTPIADVVTGSATPVPGNTAGDPLSRADFDGAAARRQTMAFQLGLARVVVDGSAIGHRIVRANDMGLFAAAGLRDGDIVTSIDGNPFHREENVVELSNQLAQAKHVRITYLRAGVPAVAKVEMVD